MSERTLQSELLDHLIGLPVDKQQQVLNFARSLAEPKGKPGTEVLLFAGAIEDGDLSEMARAIEDGCEKINADEW